MADYRPMVVWHLAVGQSHAPNDAVVELVGNAWQPLIAELKGWREFSLELKTRQFANNIADKVAV